jgi:hypothetical protein
MIPERLLPALNERTSNFQLREYVLTRELHQSPLFLASYSEDGLLLKGKGGNRLAAFCGPALRHSTNFAAEREETKNVFPINLASSSLID